MKEILLMLRSSNFWIAISVFSQLPKSSTMDEPPKFLGMKDISDFSFLSPSPTWCNLTFVRWLSWFDRYFVHGSTTTNEIRAAGVEEGAAECLTNWGIICAYFVDYTECVPSCDLKCSQKFKVLLILHTYGKGIEKSLKAVVVLWVASSLLRFSSFNGCLAYSTTLWENDGSRLLH